ncbi:MAG: hypothetical protein HF300_09095 [Ignavibacteria bacterium]|nr:hypothetical protein [Ignavibacteria bacterium]HEX2962109.1 hypothetical protein [Ignavibacteriales bacterium]MCU7499466.1 hypothetical protein [Ignavibacteria bacterium]MCU7512703.1 hypothetical protein [Ignavibacteria bacterium]MCU7521868.1 hypothetical protein [Ignavibacteria bacterium]
MKKAALFLMCAIIFSSCYDVTGPDEEKLLYGSWVLVRISGGFSGTTTDVSPEEGSKVVFTEAGSVHYYSKGALERSTTFVVKKGKSIYSTEEKSIIHFADRPELPMVIMKADKDTLILADNAYDGFSFTYMKEKY